MSTELDEALKLARGILDDTILGDSKESIGEFFAAANTVARALIACRELMDVWTPRTPDEDRDVSNLALSETQLQAIRERIESGSAELWDAAVLSQHIQSLTATLRAQQAELEALWADKGLMRKALNNASDGLHNIPQGPQIADAIGRIDVALDVAALRANLRAVAMGAKKLVTFCGLGCLTDDCSHWDDDTCNKKDPYCRIGRTIT